MAGHHPIDKLRRNIRMARKRRRHRAHNSGIGRATGFRKIREKVSPLAGEFLYEVRFMTDRWPSQLQRSKIEEALAAIRRSSGRYKISNRGLVVRSSGIRKNHHVWHPAVVWVANESDLILLKLTDCAEYVFRVYRLKASAT